MDLVWHSSLTQENANDLERVQKSAFKIILQNSNLKYKKALQILQLETLSDRRENLCLKFAQTCTKNPKFQDMFPKNSKSLNMTLRNPESYKIEKANTERYTKSPIIYMQKLLNRHCVDELMNNSIFIVLMNNSIFIVNSEFLYVSYCTYHIISL